MAGGEGIKRSLGRDQLCRSVDRGAGRRFRRLLSTPNGTVLRVGWEMVCYKLATFWRVWKADETETALEELPLAKRRGDIITSSQLS